MWETDAKSVGGALAGDLCLPGGRLGVERGRVRWTEGTLPARKIAGEDRY